jgi:plastocyanin
MRPAETGGIKISESETLGFLRVNEPSISNKTYESTVKNKQDMKTKNLVTAAIVSAGLAFSAGAQARGEKHEEQTINSSDVPAAVQQAAQAEAKGGTIVRWEKEGANFEAVIDKNGKQIGVEMDANGKVLSKHNEAKEHKEKGEKY